MDNRDDRFEPTPFGDYVLLRRIGTGGMSEVFLARPAADKRAHERYALKRLLPDLARAPNFVQLFEQETRLAARLRHPNVVCVHDAGRVDDTFFMVTEYVEGLDCWKITRRLARQIGSLPLSQVVHIVVSTLEGLHYVHTLADEAGRPLGIVHRDISPSNILVSRRGEVKLGDFGIALIPSEEVETERRSRLRGKIRYLSPEQVRGQPVDARSDLFAVGVLLAELIIGRTPFRGQTDIALLLNIRDVRLNLAEDLDERTPPELRSILLRALARQPAERHPSAAAMRDELLDFAERAGIETDPGETAATVEQLLKPGDVGDKDVLRETLTPFAHAPIGPREPAAPAAERTPSLPLSEYRVRREGETETRALAYAEVVEAVLNGGIGANDQVSVNNGPFRPVNAVPDLQGHLPLRTPTTSHIDGPGLPDRQGLFATDTVAGVFLVLARSRDTGLLVADSGAARKEVYFVDGHPIYAASNLAGELLGEYLVNRKVISRMELDMALALLPRYEGHLGDTLVAMELIDPLTLFNHITAQVRHRILDLFTWKAGSWSFFRGVVCEKRAFPLSSSAPELLHDGIHRSATDDEVAGWWRTIEAVRLAPAEEAEPPPGWWPLDEAERQALAAVDRPILAADALRRARVRAPQLGEAKLVRALHFLLAGQLVRPAD
ncbi:MAG: protein kinase [Deltaproteobacteria bacterium]|nr:protein kinase [Deltaproteobacteria bacterium]